MLHSQDSRDFKTDLILSPVCPTLLCGHCPGLYLPSSTLKDPQDLCRALAWPLIIFYRGNLHPHIINNNTSFHSQKYPSLSNYIHGYPTYITLFQPDPSAVISKQERLFHAFLWANFPQPRIPFIIPDSNSNIINSSRKAFPEFSSSLIRLGKHPRATLESPQEFFENADFWAHHPVLGFSKSRVGFRKSICSS